MNDQGPRNDVLAERIDALGRSVNALDQRMGSLATERSLTDLIASRDVLYETRSNALAEDIKELTAALATERAERQAADKENEERAVRARTFAISAIGLTISAVIALITLISRIGGTPS